MCFDQEGLEKPIQTELVYSKFFEVSQIVPRPEDNHDAYQAFDKQLRKTEDVYISNLKANEAIGLIFKMSLEPTLWYREYLIDYLGQEARRQQYQGKWMKVHILLKYAKAPKLLLTIASEKFQISQRDVFGNFLRISSLALKRLKVKYFNTSRPREVQRKLGYDDHGSLQPRHKWLPKKIQMNANPERKDFSSHYQRRSTIMHFLSD